MGDCVDSSRGRIGMTLCCLATVRTLRWACLALVALTCGCLSAPRRSESNTLPLDRSIHPGEVYTLACPDVVEVVFSNRIEYGHRARIGPDGSIELASLGSLRIEGSTIEEAALLIAERGKIPAHQVLVQVVEYNSRQMFLNGAVNGEARIVDYRGPETVVDLLKRAGGLSTDAAPDEVYVVRAQLGEGIPAEVLTVDLDAIQRKNDQRTNVRVQPLDSIYVGEKARSRIGRAIPVIFKPAFESIAEIWPWRKSPPKDEPKPAK